MENNVMANERIQWNLDDRNFGQLASSQASRTEFTPGKARSNPLDENWPVDFKVPVGTPVFNEAVNGPVDMKRVRVYKTGRNVVCDQVLVGVPSSPESEGQENDGRKERNSGYDRADV